jgi:hypothetical protein
MLAWTGNIVSVRACVRPRTTETHPNVGDQATAALAVLGTGRTHDACAAAMGRAGLFSSLIDGSDPSAGSPTETLLRLLLPLNNSVWKSFRIETAPKRRQYPVRMPH